MSQSGPYRSPLPRNDFVKQYILDSIENARKMQKELMTAITVFSKRGTIYSNDIEMVEKLRVVYETACVHERELLKQLANELE